MCIRDRYGSIVNYSSSPNFEFTGNGNYKISISGLFRTTNAATDASGAPTIYVSYSIDGGDNWTDLKNVLYLKNVAESNAREKPFNTLASDGSIKVENYNNFKLKVCSENFSDGAVCKDFRIDFMTISGISGEGYLNDSDFIQPGIMTTDGSGNYTSSSLHSSYWDTALSLIHI